MVAQLPPTGTLTFLFTDVEGSTRAWELNPARMSASLLRHNELLADAIRRHQGHVFKTVGDAFCAAFNTPHEALRAAIDAQRALAHTLRVRMALHTGTAVEREGDYYGPTLNRVARLMAIGHGGQILLSGITAELVKPAVDDNVRLIDLGAHRLRDLGQPEHVFQAAVADLPSDFPALASLGSRANNLPAQLTTFVGREHELRALNDALQTTRLLTLTGPGGIGKTRLALEVATQALDAFPNGAWFIDLSAVREGERIPETIASALSLHEEADRSHWDVAIAFLREKQLLLILDNCEHLIDHCARRASEILQAAGAVTVLATSREPLSVPGEQLWPVPTLLDAAAADDVSLNESPAVRLFIDRALLTGRPLDLSGKALETVVEICRCLDGIPLALELAASRVQSLTVPEILEHLNDRFSLLTSRDRTRLPRQQTLRGAIDWSFDLLSDAERRVFARTAAFSGGFTLAAAEVVCGYDFARADVLDTLGTLVAKSFLLRHEHDGSSRYRTLETMHEYAFEKLAAAAELEPTRHKHFDFYLAYAERWDRQFTLSQADALHAIDAEYENIRATLAWGFGQPLKTELLLRMAIAIARYWEVRGHMREARMWFARLLDRVPPAEVNGTVAAAYARAGNLANLHGDYRNAMLLGHTALKLRRQLNDAAGVAESLNNLGRTLQDAGRPKQAGTLYAEALKIFRVQNNVPAQARTLGNLGLLAMVRADHELALRNMRESLALIEDGGDTRLTAHILGGLGYLSHHAGAISDSLNYNSRSLAMLKELGDLPGVARVLNNLAEVTIAAEDIEAAHDHLVECLRLCEETGLQHELADAIDCLATIAGKKARFDDAARLIGAADAIRSAIRQTLPSFLEAQRNQVVASVEAQLGHAEFDRLRLLGSQADPKTLARAALG